MQHWLLISVMLAERLRVGGSLGLTITFVFIAHLLLSVPVKEF